MESLFYDYDVINTPHSRDQVCVFVGYLQKIQFSFMLHPIIYLVLLSLSGLGTDFYFRNHPDSSVSARIDYHLHCKLRRLSGQGRDIISI